MAFTPDGTSTAGAFSYTLSDGTQTDDARVSLVIPGNIAPVLAAALPAQSATEEQPVDFTLPAGAFTDADGDALTLTARLADGSALPGWLVFDPATGRFTGQPPQNLNGALDIVVTASEGALEASGAFTLTIAAVGNAIGGTVSLNAEVNVVFTACAAGFAYTLSDGTTHSAAGTALCCSRPICPG